VLLFELASESQGSAPGGGAGERARGGVGAAAGAKYFQKVKRFQCSPDASAVSLTAGIVYVSARAPACVRA
jgi:hypothetical protein